MVIASFTELGTPQPRNANSSRSGADVTAPRPTKPA